jgi:hypothetical protein
MKNLTSIVIMAFLSSAGLAHELTDQQRKEKIELHEKMAERHKVAAECLKSGKSPDDCNMEAMKGCPMTGENCPFVEKGHMDKQMMREHMKKMKQNNGEK